MRWVFACQVYVTWLTLMTDDTMQVKRSILAHRTCEFTSHAEFCWVIPGLGLQIVLNNTHHSDFTMIFLLALVSDSSCPPTYIS